MNNSFVDIYQTLYKITDKKISDLLSRQVADKVGKLCVKLERERIMKGLDINGAPFKISTPNYLKWKARFLGLSKKKGTKTKESLYMQKLLNFRVPKYQAHTVQDKLRLTGRLLNSLTYQIIKQPADNPSNKMQKNFVIRLKTDELRQRQAEGLIKHGYKFLGMSQQGHLVAYEKEQILALIKKESKGLLT